MSVKNELQKRKNDFYHSDCIDSNYAFDQERLIKKLSELLDQYCIGYAESSSKLECGCCGKFEHAKDCEILIALKEADEMIKD